MEVKQKNEIIVEVERILPVIINNNTFENPDIKERVGSKQDVDNLKQFCSEQLNSKVIITIEDKTKDSIFSEVRSIEVKDNSGFDALMVFIMSHGHSGGIISAYDDNYQLQDILNEFNKLSHFKDKLKFFFVQACRGVTYDTEEYQRYKDGPLKGKYEVCKDTKFHPLIMVDQYMLLASSTVEGNVASRSTEVGSIYIQSLIHIFHEYYAQEKVDLKEWLTAVNDEVCKKSEEYCKDTSTRVVPDTKNFKSNTDNLQYQSPIFVSFISKKVFLKKVGKTGNVAVATSSKNIDRYEGAGASVYEKASSSKNIDCYEGAAASVYENATSSKNIDRYEGAASSVDGSGEVKPLIRYPYSQKISNCIIFYEDNERFSKEVEYIEEKFYENCEIKCEGKCSCNSTCKHMVFKKVKINAETLTEDLDTQMSQVNSDEGVFVVFIAEIIYPKASRVTDYPTRRMVDGRTENNQTESDIKLKCQGGEIKISEIVGIIKCFYVRPKIIKFLDPTDHLEYDNISSKVQIEADSHYMVPIIDHTNADVLLFVGQKRDIIKQLFEKFYEDSDVVDVIFESSIMELNHSSRKNIPFFRTSLRKPVYLNPKLSNNGSNSDKDNIIRIYEEISHRCNDKTILTDESIKNLKLTFNSLLNEMVNYKNGNSLRFFNLMYNEAQVKVKKKLLCNIFDPKKFEGVGSHSTTGERLKMHGLNFMFGSILFLLLRLYKDGIKCEISCENSEFGLFCHLIIKTEGSSVCIQFKSHSRKAELRKENIFGSRSYFDIFKYFESFARNIDKFTENGKKLNLILWTNMPMDDHLTQMMEEIPVEGLFNVHKFKPGVLKNLFEFRQDELEIILRSLPKPNDVTIEMFERHLCFAFNQDEKDELEKKIMDLISELIDANNCEEIYDTITGQLPKWVTPNPDKKGTILTHLSLKNYFDDFKPNTL